MKSVKADIRLRHPRSIPVDVLLLVKGVRPTYDSGPILQQEQKLLSESLWWGGDEAAAEGEKGSIDRSSAGPVNCLESNE